MSVLSSNGDKISTEAPQSVRTVGGMRGFLVGGTEGGQFSFVFVYEIMIMYILYRAVVRLE